jgi:hypothetical protein
MAAGALMSTLNPRQANIVKMQERFIRLILFGWVQYRMLKSKDAVTTRAKQTPPYLFSRASP